MTIFKAEIIFWHLTWLQFIEWAGVVDLVRDSDGPDDGQVRVGPVRVGAALQLRLLERDLLALLGRLLLDHHHLLDINNRKPSVRGGSTGPG